MLKKLFFLLCITLALPSYAKQIVIIHSYHLDFPWVQQYRKGLLSTLVTGNLLEFAMDTKRKPQFAAIAEQAWQFIRHHQPDIVILADDNALKLLGPRLVKQNIPLVFLGINGNPRDYIAINKKVTGVLERPLMKRSIAMLRTIDPRIKKVKVLMENTATAKALLETSFNNKLSQHINGIEVDVSLIDSVEQWQKQTLNAQEQHYQATIVSIYAGLKNSMAQTSSVESLIQWTSAHSPLPLFALWEFSIGKGKAIGGLTISGVFQGVETAKKVNNFFATGTLDRISTPQRGALKFSAHELNRWKISLAPALIEHALFVD